MCKKEARCFVELAEGEEEVQAGLFEFGIACEQQVLRKINEKYTVKGRCGKSTTDH